MDDADFTLPPLPAFSGATFDSRAVKPGMLFVALKGERTDGHAYVRGALAAGAAAALVQADWPAPADVDPARLVRVPDVRRAFAAAARAYRRTLGAKVVGVTGSAGKTTVKELTAAFLRTLRRADGSPVRVHATAGNFNNDLGLPLTVLNCPPDADFLVLEMGTNHPGEIRYLADVAEPDVGLISSIGTAHIEFFGSQDGIAREKGELLRTLGTRPGAFAVLARENARYDLLREICTAPVETVSAADPEAALFAAALAERLPGAHNVSNALVAFGCARRFGATGEACRAALAEFALLGDRWHVVKQGPITFISDCYNANPTSMLAALDAFEQTIDANVLQIALLGDMFELGAESAGYHEQVLARAVDGACGEVFVVGAAFAAACAARPDLAAKARLCASVEEAGSRVRALAEERPVRVLVKGSHGMHLERVLEVAHGRS